MEDVFLFLADEVTEYLNGNRGIGNERVTIFQCPKGSLDRMAWCVKKCAGMPWVKIEAEVNIKTEDDIKTESDDNMEFGIKAEVKVKMESET
ncbi:hypothetical protein J3F84DRAFT_390673 [Trichoderma pleuroticola]